MIPKHHLGARLWPALFSLVALLALACSEAAPSEELATENPSTGDETPASGGAPQEPLTPSTGGSAASASVPEISEPEIPVATGTISITASSHDANVPVNVLDGRLVTRWSAYGEGEWLLIDLGEVLTLSAVDIAFYQGNVRATSFELLVGTDPNALSSMFLGSSSGTSYDLESFTFLEQPVRFIKIIGNGTADGLWNSITEVRWEGFDPTQPIVVVEPPEPDPGGAPEVPADLLNLSQWKETLPIGSSGDPDEIEQPQLSDYEHADYFFVNAAGTGVVFRAHSGGVTTDNSGYPRSELREMSGASGKNLADWSTTSGTHTMNLTGSITKVALNKPHVVVAQIHDDGDDVVMVRFEGQTPGKPTTSGELFVESGGDNIAMIDSNYTLGETYAISIVASGGRIRVSYNGVQKMDESFSVNGCYFKAGCYSQSRVNNDDSFDDDSPSDFAEVVLYSLEVVHN